ncbi:MAG: methyl-accepting chemotaxis protein [Oscillospiraceae bacterium]|nr:methyl-accepting chemotaxis protein [Oscillospiraceae bacterium]
MKNMKIYSRLISAFAVVIALSVILGIVSMVLIGMMSSRAEEMYDMHVIGIERLSGAQSTYATMRASLNRAAFESLNGKANVIDSQSAAFSEASRQMTDYMSDLERTLVSEAGKRMFQDYLTAKDGYVAAANSFFQTCRSAVGNTNAAATVDSELVSLASRAGPLDSAMTALVEAKRSLADEAHNAMDDLGFIAMAVGIGMMILIVVFSIFIAIFIATGVEKSLGSIVEKLSMSTMNITSSAAQLNDASESLATGSSRQAAAIEETSATMNETASMVQQNAENTRVAAQLALESQQAVEESGKHMSNLMNTMSELKESSDKVSKIVKTIDDIAFQTNLLAINATVEAARAGGDAGRSFAVVAQEVRDLAQKSAGASSETAEIIERNISLTDTSRTSAGRALEITEKDSEQIVKLNKLISEINAASEEQASGIKQINMAISQMEKVTQENAAVAEENAASSNSMKDEIGNLEEAISIAKGLIRDSASGGGSLLGSVRRPGGGAKNSYAPRTSSYTSPSPRKTIPAPTAYKPQGSANQARTQSGNASADAEKIIPLGDDDDF